MSILTVNEETCTAECLTLHRLVRLGPGYRRLSSLSFSRSHVDAVFADGASRSYRREEEVRYIPTFAERRIREVFSRLPEVV